MAIRILRITGIILFMGLGIVAAISFKDDELLEILFILHKKALIIMGILFMGAELILFIIEIVDKILKKVTETKNLITHLIWSLIFLVLLLGDLTIFEIIVHPKLADIEIVHPLNGAEVANLTTEVQVFARALEGQLIYIIVKTPQGTMWAQKKLFTSQFKDTLRGQAQLGEGEKGIREVFEIFAIATREELQIGILPTLPSKYIASKIVEVKRIGG